MEAKESFAAFIAGGEPFITALPEKFLCFFEPLGGFLEPVEVHTGSCIVNVKSYAKVGVALFFGENQRVEIVFGGIGEVVSLVFNDGVEIVEIELVSRIGPLEEEVLLFSEEQLSLVCIGIDIVRQDIINQLLAVYGISCFSEFLFPLR